jgi:hypothetical protein
MQHVAKEVTTTAYLGIQVEIQMMMKKTMTLMQYNNKTDLRSSEKLINSTLIIRQKQY